MKFVTITPNPSIDWTLYVSSLSLRGMVKAEKEDVACGGKGINVARVLHRMGENTLAIFPCGGHSGQDLIDAATGEGLPFDAVSISGAIRRNVVAVDEANGEVLKINTPGPRLSEDEWQELLTKAVDSCDEGDWAVAGGSLPPGVPEDFYRWISGRLRDKGAMMALDASGPPLERALNFPGIIRPHVVKVNLAELSGLWSTSLISLKSVWSQGYRFAEGSEYLVSHGARGALVLSCRGCWIGYSTKTAARYVVGGGDSLLAGYVKKRQQDVPEDESLRFALACATATALAPLHRLASPDDIPPCLEQVRVLPIQKAYEDEDFKSHHF